MSGLIPGRQMSYDFIEDPDLVGDPAVVAAASVALAGDLLAAVRP
jgi:hypothetical protein